MGDEVIKRYLSSTLIWLGIKEGERDKIKRGKVEEREK